MEESLKQEEARIKADYLARADQRLEQLRQEIEQEKANALAAQGRPLCRRARQAGAGV